MKKFVLNGVEMKGEDVPFTMEEEPWAKYRLPDGTVLRLKIVMTDVIRLSAESTGEPQYAVRSGNIMAVDAPPEEPEVH